MVFLVKFIKIVLLVFKKMLDDLDKFILKSFLEKGVTTTWEIAKEFYWGDKPRNMSKRQENEFHSKKTMVIEYRMKKLEKENLIKIEKNSEKIFVLDSDKVLLRRHKFPNGFKESLLVQDTKGYWSIYQIQK